MNRDRLNKSEGHLPVLMKEFVQFFHEVELKVFFDGTVGAGGHARALLEDHPELEKFIGCDVDPVARNLAKQALEPWKNKVEIIEGNFERITEFLDERGIACINGFFVDIGVSSMQLDHAERGFSFLREGPLDMRMDPNLAVDAKILLQRSSQKELEEIFKNYGEEPRWREAARVIVEARRKNVIETTGQLVEVLRPVLRGRGHVHPLTLVFQALRIAVNKELQVLERGLQGALDRLCIHGRLGAISFHSLEDRIVKNLLRDRARKRRETGEVFFKVLTKKPIGPSLEEKRKNVRSRSAKMRFIERLGNGEIG